VIYLDNASTTWPKPPAVAEAVARFISEIGASPGRGGYKHAVKAERIVSDVRRRLVDLIGGDDVDRMILTTSCTDSLNIAIKGALSEGDHVVTTMLEHNSVNRPLEALKDAGVITLTRVGFSDDGFVDPDDIAKAVRPNTRLITLNHASNVLGTIQPAAEVGRIAREHDALFLLDAAQSIGVLNIDMNELGCDLLAFPAHKELLGPPGVGGLYVGPRARLRPFREGGTGIDSASRVQPVELPFALESGTANAPGIAGLQAALDYVRPADTLVHMHRLVGMMIGSLGDNSRIRILGTLDATRRVGTLAFVVEGIAADDFGAMMDETYGIAVRSGLHCAPYVHRQLTTFPDGAVRVSPGPFTKPEEIETACKCILECLVESN